MSAQLAPEKIVRFVVTHPDPKGRRTLLDRFTHATREEAEKELESIRANNCEESIWELFGDPSKIEVRSCECWKNNDPVGVWFD